MIKVRMRSKTNEEALKELGITVNYRQLERIRKMQLCLSKGLDTLVMVSDERTGQRYGKRHPGAVKIGHTSYEYQLWMERSKGVSNEHI